MAMTLDPSRPNTIFKYEPASERAVQNLEKAAIYFGSPRAFNDPFDCSIATQLEHDPEGFKKWIADFLPDQDTTKLGESTFEQLRETFVLKTNAAIKKLAATIGVTCFSDCGTNLLMWAHYASKYEGFCIEFSTDFKPFEGVKRVEYQSGLPTFKVAELADMSKPMPVAMSLFLTKSADWKYEREWRSFHQRAGTVMSYSAESVRTVYFGPRIKSDLRERLSDIVAKRYPSANQFQGYISRTEFKVDFEKVEK